MRSDTLREPQRWQALLERRWQDMPEETKERAKQEAEKNDISLWDVVSSLLQTEIAFTVLFPERENRPHG